MKAQTHPLYDAKSEQCGLTMENQEETARSRITDVDAHVIVELLFVVSRDLSRELDRFVAPLGLNLSHTAVLHVVRHQAGISIGEAVGVLHVSKNALSRLLKELIDKGYLEQSAGDSDRRERRLFLSDEGLAKAEAINRFLNEQIKVLCANVDPRDLSGFKSVMLSLVSPAMRPTIDTRMLALFGVSRPN